MGLTDDFNDDKNGLPIVYMAVGVVSFILLVFLIVILANKKPSNKNPIAQQPIQDGAEEIEQLDDDLALGESGLTSDQLDFWDMYKDSSDSSHKERATVSGSSYDEIAQQMREEEEDPDLSEGGIKTKVVLPDGSEQWVMINAYIAKNNYDYIGLVYQEPLMKYYENSEKKSNAGVNVSKASGNVNFGRLKRTGIDYAMIRLGSRGYQNGQLSLDENFETNMENAAEAGLDIGITFFSQATTADEAREEVAMIMETLEEHEYKITYPIVFDMHQISNDTSRTDTVNRMQLTEIANIFCSEVSQAGYTPMIYGSKYWLLRRIDLTKLSKYDIWLAQNEDIPDYPYKYAMWQYTQTGEIDGIPGEADLSISFIDYSLR